MKTMGGERREGVLIMADKTSVLPIMAMRISGTFSAQFMMTIISGRELLSISDWFVILINSCALQVQRGVLILYWN